MTHAFIVYDTGEGIVIYEAFLDDDELRRMESVHNVYGNVIGTSEVDDQFLGDLTNQLHDIRKVFDATVVENEELTKPIAISGDAKIFVTGFVP